MFVCNVVSAELLNTPLLSGLHDIQAVRFESKETIVAFDFHAASDVVSGEVKMRVDPGYSSEMFCSADGDEKTAVFFRGKGTVASAVHHVPQGELHGAFGTPRSTSDHTHSDNGQLLSEHVSI